MQNLLRHAKDVGFFDPSTMFAVGGGEGVEQRNNEM